jgi:hypothetical protein
MSATSAPFGLRPAFHPSGTIRPVQSTIASAYNANILQNQPVTIAADGTVTATAIGGRSVGSFQGVEFTDVEGRRRVTNRWVANTVATDIVAWITRDPAIIYEIQSNATIALADVGSQANTTVITAGSATAGFSQLMLDTATLTNSGSAQYRIVGITPGADNALGDAFVILQVQIALHQDVADRIAY